MRTVCILVLCCAFFVPVTARAEENKETHDELRALRDGMIAAIAKSDIDVMCSYLATNCVVTWQDATVSRGREGVRAYYARMMEGPGRIVQSFKTTVNVDELTILYGGDTGISFGTSVDEFNLTGGMKFTLNGRWSAALVKEDGRWRIANCHMSTNLFDNPLLRATRKTMYWSGAICVGIGLVVGVLVGRRRKAAA